MSEVITVDVCIGELISVARKKKAEQGAMAFGLMANTIIEVRRLIVEAVRENKLDAKLVADFTAQLDALTAEPIPQKAVVTESRPESLIPESPETKLCELRRRQPGSDINSEEVEADMLRIASDMREAAVGVQSTLQRDRRILAMTADLQDENSRATVAETKSADAVRRSKRLSFFFTIFMVVSSAIIFVVLVPFIIVT